MGERAASLTIRREPLDSPVAQTLIAALDAELMGLYPEDDSANHFRLDREEVAPGRGAFFVAYDDATPIGCGAVRLIDVGVAEIKRMYTVPAWRGRGVGRAVLETLEEEARRLGATRLLLETGPRQPQAIRLYERAGFVRTSAFGEYKEHPLSVFMGRDLI
jgi:GNAT superfamily N-acetyltransferase